MIEATIAKGRAERLLELVEYFRDGGGGTAKQLAERFGVNVRTIQRDLLAVDRFVPLWIGWGWYYHKMDRAR